MDNFRRRLLSQDADPKPYVDLGLPSGTLWAKGNLVKNGTKYAIGEETDFGTYISWGNITGHNEGEGYNFNDSNYGITAGKSLTGNISANDAAHDICLKRLGAPWHLPTKQDFQELYDYTDKQWTAINGVNGRKFMKKTDHSVYIFFPASGRYNNSTTLENRGTYGYYWSSSFYSSTYAYLLYFSGSSLWPQYNSYRKYGLAVRPIYIR